MNKKSITLLIVLLISIFDSFGQHREELWIKNGERNIYGIISRPDTKAKRQGVAIIAHGFNGTHHSGMTYFELFNSLGYQCYTFDFPSGSIYSRSNNDTMKMSILNEQSDLEAVIEYFSAQADVDKSKIIVIGESQGGLVAALAAANIKNRIDKLILIFPALCIPDNWEQRYPSVSDIPERTELWGVGLSREFFLELRTLDVFGDIGKYKGPVQIIQGDADNIVSMKDSERAITLYKSANLHVIKGAGHGFKPHEQKESLSIIKQFMAK